MSAVAADASVSSVRKATAFAPACVGNAAVGFDILGHSIAGIVDYATVERIDEPVVRIEAIRGVTCALPRDPERNTAGAALLALRAASGMDDGFAVSLDKRIAPGSGMASSAASAVAALVAANALLDRPLPRDALYPFAVAGESASSGERHGDNVGPQLLGGLVLATDRRRVRISVPAEWHCALVHPHIVLETSRSRTVLKGSYELADFVAQSANLALVMTGCMRGDASLVREGLKDVLVEPRRAPLIPNFARVREAALDHGALGASISGGGPSVFGWFEDAARANLAAAAMRAAFGDAGLEADILISPIRGPAAGVVS
ncbi:MAG: homoserine kinase [Gammaproteobacteria bacterium]